MASDLAGLKNYWSEPQEQTFLQWEKWLQLFIVAIMAKLSISLTEITRTGGANEGQP